MGHLAAGAGILDHPGDGTRARHRLREKSAATETWAHSRLAAASALPLTRGLLLYTPIIFAGNLLGAFLRYPVHGSAVLFPPYAALTAVLIASPRSDWIWYILVGAVGHFATSVGQWPVSWVLLSDVANVTRAVVAALLLRRLLGREPRLDSVLSLLVFVGVAVLLAPAIGAAIGATNVVFHNGPATYLGTWTSWFVSNALTALTMLPFLLGAIRWAVVRRASRLDRRVVIEAVFLVAVSVLTCAIVYLSFTDPRLSLATAYYTPIPLLIWAALRFGAPGLGFALTVVSYALIIGTDRRTAGFSPAGADAAMMRLQVFIFLTATPMLCIAVVTTARKDAVQLYRALLASLHDEVAILDARGMVIRVNESWRRHADAPSPCPFERAHSGDDFLAACRQAADALAALHPEDRDPAPRRVLAGATAVLLGYTRRFETEYEREHNGRREWYTIRIESLERADGGAVVTRADISARRDAQAMIEEQRRELSHLARVAVLGQLSGALAHELRQPLSAILANAEAARHLINRQVIDTDELREILNDIVSEDRRASHVIAGLRAMLKRGETRVQPIAPADLVRETLELAHAEMITRRVTATADVEPDLPLVLADRVQIQQVLLNLVLNASEAMSGIVTSGRFLFLGASRAGGNILFSVRDCGPGIPAELIERLFEPFVTTKAEGLGLGLSIARTVIAAHGGRIWAENHNGSGATVQFILPAAPALGVAMVPPDAVQLTSSPAEKPTA